MPTRLVSQSPDVHLAAFGKHPGWDDHIDDPGLDSDSLIAFKRALYTEGIGRNIDSGAWDALEKSDRLQAFDHLIVQRRGGDAVVARLWSSSDGKGRTRYPMVLAAHCRGVAVDAALADAAPVLESLRDACLATSSAEHVRSELDAARSRLRRRLCDLADRAAAGSPQPAQIARHPIKHLLGHDRMGPDRQGLLRVLYQIEREMWGYRRISPQSSTTIRTKTGELQRAQSMRVPRCADSAADAALLWLAFLLTQFHEAAPVMVVVPVAAEGVGAEEDRDWVDVIVGEAGAQELFCLRAGRRDVPCATEIPYTLDEEFSLRAQAFLDQAAAGDGVSFPAPVVVEPKSADRGGLFSRIASVLRGSA